MKKVMTIFILFSCYAVYSGWVYTYGTTITSGMSADARDGKQLWQENNCQSCHQLYGLGGYMGPDLTSVTTDKNRGIPYTKAMMRGGGNRMPNFDLTETETDKIIAYLSYVNITSVASTK